MWSSVFYDWKHHFQPLGRGGAVKIFSQTMSQSPNELISNEGVCRTAPATPGLLNRIRKKIIVSVYCQHASQKISAHTCWKKLHSRVSHVKYCPFIFIVHLIKIFKTKKILYQELDEISALLNFFQSKTQSYITIGHTLSNHQPDIIS